MTIFWKAPVAQGGLGHGSYGWVVHNGGEGWGRDLEKNFKYKKNSNTKDAQEIHTHHAIKQEYTNKPGRNWSLLKWLLNLLPTWRTSETCLENTNTNTKVWIQNRNTNLTHQAWRTCSLQFEQQQLVQNTSRPASQSWTRVPTCLQIQIHWQGD